MQERTKEKQLDWRGFKRWRTIQVAAILPLCVTVVLMIYFREAAEFHVVAFFLVLIVGVLMPQISGDMIQSHLLLKEELSKEVGYLQGEVQNLRKGLKASQTAQEGLASPLES
jgi:hypothetical protein